MEGNNVRIVQDGPDDRPEPSIPARRWRLAAASATGVLVVVLVLVPGLRSTDDPLTTPLEVFPVATTTVLTTTTTTAQPITATPITGQTIRASGIYIQPRVERFCQRAIAATPPRLEMPEEWFSDDYGDLIYINAESSKARNAQDGPLVDALAPVIADLEDVREAFEKAFDAVFREGSDDWAHQFTLVERLCERLTRNVEVMVSYGTR